MGSGSYMDRSDEKKFIEEIESRYRNSETEEGLIIRRLLEMYKDLDDKASKASLACIIKSILFNTKEESIKSILFQLDALDEQINNKTKTEETRKRLELNRAMIRGMLKAVIKDKQEYFERVSEKENAKTKRY